LVALAPSVLFVPAGVPPETEDVVAAAPPPVPKSFTNSWALPPPSLAVESLEPI